MPNIELNRVLMILLSSADSLRECAFCQAALNTSLYAKVLGSINREGRHCCYKMNVCQA